jgi:hypothetical protein
MNRTHFLNDWMFGFVNVTGSNVRVIHGGRAQRNDGLHSPKDVPF